METLFQLPTLNECLFPYFETPDERLADRHNMRRHALMPDQKACYAHSCNRWPRKLLLFFSMKGNGIFKSRSDEVIFIEIADLFETLYQKPCEYPENSAEKDC